MQRLYSLLLQEGRFGFSSAIILPCILMILLIVDLLRSYSKLRRIPGPFLAAWSNIPRFYWVWTRRAHEIHIALHEKYGKLVRVGPNMVSVGDPAEIHNIYGITGKFQKVCCSTSSSKSREKGLSHVARKFSRIFIMSFCRFQRAKCCPACSPRRMKSCIVN